jgi:ankyrin repeat protein
MDDNNEEEDIQDDFLYAGTLNTIQGWMLTLARTGDQEWLIELLAAHPELVSATDSNGNTPLHFASANGHTGTLSLLDFEVE